MQMTDKEKELACIYYSLYQEEIDNFYSLDEKEQKEIIETAKKQIEALEEPEKKLAKYMGIEMLAIVYYLDLRDDPINEKNVNDLYIDRKQWIEEAKRFFEKPEAEEIFKKYGIQQTYQSGDYKQEKDFIENVFEEEGFKIDDPEKFKYILRKLWKNEKQFPTEKILDEESIKENGIGIKEFLFCEEYIKTGKITKTCDSLGIGRTTCYDYLKKEEVKKYLEERRTEIKNESDDLLKTGFFDCFQELHKLVTKEEYIENHDRIKAIDCYLKHYEQSIYKQNNNEIPQ